MSNLASRSRILLAVYFAGFAIGALVHLRHFAVGGWRPYGWAPPALELFWSLLVMLDTAVVVLLATGRRRSGLVLAVAIMVTDVLANTYALTRLAIPMSVVAVLLQALFLGFILGSIAFLWRPDTGAP